MSWIQTYTGRKFFPLDPREVDVDIEDIAHSLAMSCRYAGHCTRYYSVAEHSVWVSRYVSSENQLTALLHDASEAYLTDVPRPIKPFLNGYKEMEERLERVISNKFGLIWPLPSEVKSVDVRILGDEKKQLMTKEPEPWALFGEPLGITDKFGLGPLEAKALFLRTFRQLYVGA